MNDHDKTTAERIEELSVLKQKIQALEQRERKRVEEETRRTQDLAERLAREMAVIVEIGRVVGSTLDLNQVYERVATEARKLIPYDRLLVNRKITPEGEFVVAYITGVDNPRRRTGDVYPSQGAATGAVMGTRAGILIQPDDAEEIKDLYPNLYETFKTGLRSTMSVPLISMDEVIGSLNFRSRKLKAYTEQDLRLAERIGMQVAGAIANAHLYKDLKETEKSLRESEEKYRLIAENTADLISVLDINLRFTYISPATMRLRGFTVEETMEQTLEQVLTPESMQLGLAAFEKEMQLEADGTADPERTRILELEEYKKDGSMIWMEVNLSFLRDENRKPVAILVVSRDITERKRAEEERRNLEERLQRAEKMEALGQLAGGVAHDLNNVLGVLSGYSELLLEEIPEGNRSRRHVEKILQSTEKGAAIIQDLLTLARRGVTASEVIHLSSVVSNFLRTPVFERLKDLNPRVTFRTECDPNLLNIKGSPVHLEKTLINLVSNAVEAISGTGEVTIRTESRYLDKPLRGYDEVKEGDYAVLTVSDTGMGIPAENREKIFEPFYTKKTMGRSGTGLGLAIVWGTVKDHNGYIDLQTEVGEGTTFTLYFPVTREELIAPQQKAPIGQYRGNGESVLVVDDVAEQRDIAAGLLTRLGYQVHVVSSGEEAVEYLKGNIVDILVLDMIMPPGIDGLETYKQVLEINPNQKAILVSGFSETERVREAQKLGAGAYVKKPYVRETIGVAIRDELSGK